VRGTRRYVSAYVKRTTLARTRPGRAGAGPNGIGGGLRQPELSEGHSSSPQGGRGGVGTGTPRGAGRWQIQRGGQSHSIASGPERSHLFDDDARPTDEQIEREQTAESLCGPVPRRALREAA
jgi:hypothetical protein